MPNTIGDFPPWGLCKNATDAARNNSYRYALTSGRFSIFNWFAIVQGILILSKAYKNIKEADAAAGEYLAGINAALAEIQKGIEEIKFQIAALFTELQKMEARLLASITEAQADGLIGQAEYACDDLSLRTDENSLKANKIQILIDLQTIGENMSGVARLKQGIDAVLSVAPLLACWLDAFLLAEKAKQTDDPTYIIVSPWKHPTLMRLKKLFQTTLGEIAALDHEYQTNVIPKLILPGYVLVPDGNRVLYRDRVGRTSETPPPGLDALASPLPGDFMWDCPQIVDGAVIKPAQLVTYKLGTTLEDISWRWRTVDIPATYYESMVLNLFTAQQKKIEQMITFYRIAKPIYEGQDDFMIFFQPPPGWQNL